VNVFFLFLLKSVLGVLL
jgi:uncharacterized protein (TIGR01589 family)